jgi:hypothetical protein
MVLGEVEIFPANGSSGTGNMQVSLRPGGKFVVVFVRCHFRRLAGSGTDTATLTMDLDSDLGTDFDVRLLTQSAAGVAADVHARFDVDTLDCWTFKDEEALTFNWTNPDPGEIAWGLTVGIRRWQ